jgi:hypothetical protein
LVNLGSLEHFGFDGVWLEVDVQVPLLDFFGVRNHFVQLLDALNSLGRLLEETLSNVSHHSLVLPNLRRNPNQRAQLRREVDVAALLSNLKQRLVSFVNFNIVGGFEVVDHIGARFVVALVEDVVLGVHVPLDLVHLVRAVRPVLGHDDCSLEFSVDEANVVALAPFVY